MLHLISADLPSDALALVGQLQCRLSAKGLPPQVLDLSGQGLLAGQDWGLDAVSVFQRWDYQLLTWGRIKPGLNDWLELLNLQEARPERCPPLPGLDQVLQCVALAEWLAPFAAGGSTARSAQEPGPERVVLLPPLHQALELLELALTGPALVDQWLEPLLLWWQETRQSLSRLDLLLRLNLPDAEALRLAPRWRQHLQHLAALLADPGCHQLLCVLDGGALAATHLGDRLCQAYLRGFPPARLWLAGPETAAALLVLEEIRGPMVVGHGPQLHQGGQQLDAWLEQPCGAEIRLDWQMDDEPASGRLLLPGLRKGLLQVKQIDQSLVIQVGGSAKLVSLPEPLVGCQCIGAKISGRHLLLQFQ